MASTLGQINPLRYRGYVYDSETGLYYLQSRYYNPETSRYISADGQLNPNASGSNQFAYCSNNPVNMSDPSGHVGYSIHDYYYRMGGYNLSYEDDNRATFVNSKGDEKIFWKNSQARKIQNDINNFDWNNTDEQKVIDATYFSAYKGRLIIKHGLPAGSFSFGVIFIGEDNRIEIVKHEYGHTVQLSILGPQKYFTNIVVPSLTCYYLNIKTLEPWEASAHTLGGINDDRFTTEQKILGMIYIAASKLIP